MSNKIVFVYKLQGQKFLVSPVYSKKDWIKAHHDSYKRHLQEIVSIMNSHSSSAEEFKEGIKIINLFYDSEDVEVRTMGLLDDFGCCTFLLYGKMFNGKLMEVFLNDYEVEGYINSILSWRYRRPSTTIFTEEGTAITIKRNNKRLYECSIQNSDNEPQITSGFDLMQCLKALTDKENSSNKRNMYYCYEKGEDLYAY